MNWDAIGAISETVGALGVVFSLLYLAFQIRAQSRESRLAAVTELTRELNEVNGPFSQRDIAAVWVKGAQDFSSLDPTEVIQFGSQAGRLFRAIQSMYGQYTQGRLDLSTWRSIERLLDDYTSLPGIKAWWPTRSDWFRDDFVSFVKPYIDSSKPQRIYGKEVQGPS